MTDFQRNSEAERIQKGLKGDSTSESTWRVTWQSCMSRGPHLPLSLVQMVCAKDKDLKYRIMAKEIFSIPVRW